MITYLSLNLDGVVPDPPTEISMDSDIIYYDHTCNE